MFLCFVLIAISITSTVILCSKRKNEIDPLSVGPPRVVRLKSRKWSRLKSRIKKRLRSAFEEKRHRGISISAFYKGEALISAVAGIGKFEAGGKIRPIEDDTMFMPYSVTKGMCATAIATLADRGTIEYDQTIQSIWPQFNCKGKRNVTIATAISHRAGLQHTSIYFLLSGILGYIQKGWKEVCFSLSLCFDLHIHIHTHTGLAYRYCIYRNVESHISTKHKGNISSTFMVLDCWRNL